MDNNKKAHIELDNLAVPEVRFDGGVLANDTEREDMHVFSDNLAVPEVRVGKIAHDKNKEAQDAKLSEEVVADKVEASVEKKPMHIELDNLAIPEVRFDATKSNEAQAPKSPHKKMVVDYSGAIPQVTYIEE